MHGEVGIHEYPLAVVEGIVVDEPGLVDMLRRRAKALTFACAVMLAAASLLSATGCHW